MKFDLKKTDAWGVAFSEEGLLAVLMERRGEHFALRHMIRGKLDVPAQWKNLKKAFASRMFYVPIGAGYSFNECWKEMPAHARKKKLPSSFATPNVSFKNIDNLSAVKRAEIPTAVRTQMEQHCAFGNPAVAFASRPLPDGTEAVLGAAVPDEVVQQDLKFWAAFGFKMPQISLDAVANLNLYLGLAGQEQSAASEWTLLIHSNGAGFTCFQLLRNNRLQLNFEAPCELLGLGDDELMQLLEGAVRQASQRCSCFQMVRDTLTAYWAEDECKEAPPAPLLTRVVFLSWAVGGAQEEGSLDGDVEQIHRLSEKFGALGLSVVCFDPLGHGALQVPDKYRELLPLNRLAAQQAIGLAMQGLGSGRQRSAVGGQRSEDRGRKTEDRRQNPGDRRQNPGDRRQNPGDRTQRSAR